MASAFRAGRVFLVGDAAHRHPPTGGLGLTSAIHDVQNLCWKVALVLAGDTAPALLDTYEAERRPVDQRNAQRSLENTMNHFAIGAALGVSHEHTPEQNMRQLRRMWSGRPEDAGHRAGVLRAMRAQSMEFSELNVEYGYLRRRRHPGPPRPVHRLAAPGRQQRARGCTRGRAQPDPRPPGRRAGRIGHLTRGCQVAVASSSPRGCVTLYHVPPGAVIRSRAPSPKPVRQISLPIRSRPTSTRGRPPRSARPVAIDEGRCPGEMRGLQGRVDRNRGEFDVRAAEHDAGAAGGDAVDALDFAWWAAGMAGLAVSAR